MRSQLAALCVFLLGISAFAADVAPPAAPDKVLVLPFDAIQPAQQAKWISQSVQQNMLAELATMKTVTGVAGTTATTDASQAIDAAKAAGTRYAVFGSYQLSSDGVRFTGQIVDTSGNVVGGLISTGNMRDFFGIEDALADQLRDALTPRTPVASTMPTTDPGLASLGQANKVYPWDSNPPLPHPGGYNAAPAWENYPTYPTYPNNLYNNAYYPGYGYSGYGYPSYGFFPSTGFNPYGPAQGPQQAVGNVPGPTLNTMQNPPSNTMQNPPRNTMQSHH